MDDDLPALARHLGQVLGACGVATLAVGVVVWFLSQGGPPAGRHEDAVIVLAVLGATELALWFGLDSWAAAIRDRGTD